MSVLSLTDAKSHLNISGVTHDDELEAMIDAAEAAIALRVGPLEGVSVTERVAGGSRALVVNRLPVVTLSSVTPVGGSALDTDDLTLSPAGVVTYAASDTCFGERSYDVVYVAGRATCPADLMMAVKELVRHMWDTQRGGARRPGSPQSEAASNTLPGAAYLFPFRVEQLIAPHELSTVGGFA